MSSPVHGNFGHIRESGVLLLTKEDSDLKHQRNIILATASVGAFFFVGIPALIRETEKEYRIRDIGRHYPNLSYSMCVNLEQYGEIIYKGLVYKFQTREQFKKTPSTGEVSEKSEGS
jgi:hypothetical protein